jgi:hypothetical protein
MKSCLLCLRWLVISFSLGSCQCGGKPPTPTLYHPFIFYHNASGQDLFDPSFPEAYKLDSIRLNGNPPSVANLSIANTSRFSDVNMPKGFAMTFTLVPSTSKVIITIGKKTTDTLYYTFSSITLNDCRYNRMIVKPPAGTTSFPLQFPVTVTK